MSDVQTQCVKYIEAFAVEYVNKWFSTEGDSAKASGWAIMQAAASLRDHRFPVYGLDCGVDLTTGRWKCVCGRCAPVINISEPT